MTDLILWVILIAGFGGEYALARWVAPWLGAVLPALWLAVVIWLMTQGQMTSWRDYLMAALGFFVLLVLWGRGISTRNAKIQTENDRIDNTILR